MGGVKKRSISQSEKSQQSSEKGTEEKKEKKEKGKRAGAAEKRVSFSVKIDEKNLTEMFTSSKSLTVYELASKLSIPPSLANSTLKSYEARGIVQKVAGYSGHYVYRMVATPAAS
jgi:small subunit ribosomal protein S25e